MWGHCGYLVAWGGDGYGAGLVGVGQKGAGDGLVEGPALCWLALPVAWVGAQGEAAQGGAGGGTCMPTGRFWLQVVLCVVLLLALAYLPGLAIAPCCGKALSISP